MKRSAILLLLGLTGCGALDSPRTVARKACPTLTSAEFGLLYDASAVLRDNGATKEERRALIWNHCIDNPFYDANSECRDCNHAVIKAVW